MLVKSNFSYNLYDLKNVPKDPNLLTSLNMIKKVTVTVHSFSLYDFKIFKIKQAKLKFTYITYMVKKV